ncbi:unnamed protein product, partial [marine sediment metagenome]
MAVDIGSEALGRSSNFTYGYTIINKDTPAIINGTITSIDVWAGTTITGFRIGT